MPSRIIREGINSSAKINSLTPLAELFYRRLMTVADDYGRFYASPATIRGACWPTCPERVTEKQIQQWINECLAVDVQLLSVYESAGCKYLQFWNFGQQTRGKSKFPEPDKQLLSNCEADAKPSRISYSESYFDSRIAETPASAKPSPNGSRFTISEIPHDWIEFTGTMCWSLERSQSVFESFRDYWMAQPGAKGRKTDWLATWRNWCRRENERKSVNGLQQPPRKRRPNYRMGEME